MTQLNPEIKAAIEETARVTVDTAMSEAAKLEASRTETNHFRAMESLLYNYITLSALVADEAAYMESLEKTRSHSITVAPRKGSSYRDREEVMEEAYRQRAIAFEETKLRFDAVDRVVRQFKDEREFIVVRMYYFHQDPDGNPGERYTWEQITDILAERGILFNEKTARRWRSKIVADMAVVMFGKLAAISTQTRRACQENVRNGGVLVP